MRVVGLGVIGMLTGSGVMSFWFGQGGFGWLLSRSGPRVSSAELARSFRGLAGQEVGLLGLLGLAWLAEQLGVHGQPGLVQQSGDTAGGRPVGVQRYGVAVCIFEVHPLVAGLESEQQVAAWAQYPAELGKHCRQVPWWGVRSEESR